MGPVRAASIGLGWWGESLAAAGEAAGLQLVSCFARGEEQRAEFAARHRCRAATSLDELLSDDEVEAVLLATPHTTHADIIERAAAAGKHVFVEKPLTLTVVEGRRAVTAAAEAGVVLQVGHNRRRQPANRRLKSLVASGELGDVHYIEANLSNNTELTPRTGWRADPRECPGGSMTALGVHMVDTLIYLVGRPTRISAFSRQLLGRSALDDVTTATMEFDSGALGTLATSMVVPSVARVAVFGTSAAAWNEVDGERFYTQGIHETERTERQVESLDTVLDQLGEFVAAVRGTLVPEVDGRTALENVAVLEALVASATDRRIVELDEIRSR